MKKLLIILTGLMVLGCTEDFNRKVKTAKSNWTGGLNRRIVLLNCQGDTLRVWEGKFDVGVDPNTGTFYWDLDNKRVMVDPGSGILINEEI